MKKILYLLIIFTTFILNVSAYTEIDQYNFKLLMDKEGYKTNIYENGAYACLDGEIICDETFIYSNYQSESEAQEAFKKLTDVSSVNVITKEITASYNVDNTEQANYSYIQFDFTEEGSIIHSYLYIFRVNNSVIKGAGDISHKEHIDKVINEAVDDSVTERVDEVLSSLANQVKPAETPSTPEIVEKKNDKKFFILIGCGIGFVIIIIIIIITFTLKKKKKKQKDVVIKPSLS